MTPIVLIPGLVCTAELFAPQAAALWSDGPVTVANTLEGETIDEIAAAILASAPPRFALGGLSMGGYIALEIMRQAPERVLKLALLDTAARPEAPEGPDKRRGLIARARAGEYEAVLREMMPNLVAPEHKGDAALIGRLVDMGLAIGVEGFARQQEAIISRPDSRPSLAQIAVPTLVLVGAQDAVTPPDRSEEMAAAIPGARLVVVPDSGHISTLEQPDAVNRALVDWIRG